MSLTGNWLQELIRAYPFTSFYLAMCVWAVLLLVLIGATR